MFEWFWGGIGKYLNETESKKELKIARAISLLTSFSIVIFFVGSIIIFSRIDPAYEAPDILFGRISALGEALFLLPYLIAGLIAVEVIFSLRSWWKKAGSCTTALATAFMLW